MKQIPYFSHKRSEDEKHPFFIHAKGTARRAEQFASAFQAGPFAQNAGWYHDVGHCSLAFQRRLLQNGPKVDHTSSGAYELWNAQRPLEAMCVAGSHAGLLDYGTPYAPQPGTFYGRLNKVRQGQVPDYWFDPQLSAQLQSIDYPERIKNDPIAQHFFLRFLFSCVVDAGWLDTEAFMKGRERPKIPDMSVLLQQWEHWISTIPATDASQYKAIQECGTTPPGCYLLEAAAGPTTILQTIAFALQHAVTHQKTHLIYVVSHTASIEPVVEQLCTIFDTKQILGIHAETTQQEPEEHQWNNADNWDVPIVVTTPAVLFESLYGNRGPICRKVHNLANAVIILEEPNQLPEAQLTPCAIALQQLVTQFQTTLLLRTVHGFQMPFLPTPMAITPSKTTPQKQPALQWEDTISIEHLCDQLGTQTVTLCIVNRSETVAQLYAKMKDRCSVICITDQLTPRHRQEQLEHIQECLQKQQSIVICATPQIEAYPSLPISVVYREQTGLDGVQRTVDWCSKTSCLCVFSFDSHIPDRREQAALTVRQQQPTGTLRTWLPAYFETWNQALQAASTKEQSITDRHHARFHMERGNFATLGTRFHLTETSQVTLYVPNAENTDQITHMEAGDSTREDLQQLQADALRISYAQCESLAEHVTWIPNTNSAILTDVTTYHPILGLCTQDE